MTTHRELKSFDEALLTPQYLADPYPYYAQLRENDPVHWSDRLNAWVLTGYDDIRTALRDSRLISSQRVDTYARELGPEAVAQLKPLYVHIGKWIGNMDPPDHTRLRRLVNVVFTPRMVESLRPDLEQIITELLDRIEPKGQTDFIADFAYPLPAIVIAQMLGVPRSDREQFMSWSDDLTAYAGTGKADFDAARAASASAQALSDFLKSLVKQRRSKPQNDLISSLVQLEDEGDKLTEQELLSMCGFLLVAGHETTMGLLGNGMLALLRHPQELERLRDDPQLIGSAVEEMLRYDCPIQHQTRVAGEDMQMGGKSIKKDDRFILFLGAANRDPNIFPDPDALDVGRSPNKHLAFGFGIHYCLGAPLARLEAKIAFPKILQRFDDLQLVNDNIEHRCHTSNRNPVALPMTFKVASTQ